MYKLVISVAVILFIGWIIYFISLGGYLKGEEFIIKSLKNESEVTYNNVTYGCKLVEKSK